MNGINDFVSYLKGGGSRANKFEVVVDFPAFAGGPEEIRSTAFLVTSTQLPGSNLGVIEQPFRGRVLKFWGDRTFDEWSCSFLNDGEMTLRNTFERWQNALNGYSSNQGISNLEDGFSNVSVYQLNNNGTRIKEYNLKLAWPSVVAPVELAQDSNNVVSQFEVTFQYSDIDNGQST